MLNTSIKESRFKTQERKKKKRGKTFYSGTKKADEEATRHTRCTPGAFSQHQTKLDNE